MAIVATGARLRPESFRRFPAVLAQIVFRGRALAANSVRNQRPILPVDPSNLNPP
jgi:hypothetical protein